MLALTYYGETGPVAPVNAAPASTVCMPKSDLKKKIFWTSVITAINAALLTGAISGIAHAVEERRHPERVQRRLQDELKFLKRRVENRRMHRR